MRKDYLERADELYERTLQTVAQHQSIRQLHGSTFIGHIIETKRVSYGSERLFYVKEHGELIPRTLAPSPLNEFL